MMENDTQNELSNYLSKEAIRECLLRYTRGVDRFDRDMVLSAYHDDAIDDHGSFVGNREAFVDWAFEYHAANQISTQHIINNTSIELSGDTAHAETYFTFLGQNRTPPNVLAFGRYLDRLEKRAGKWAIVARVCIVESVNDLIPMTQPTPSNVADAHVSQRHRGDISYNRPLEITRRVTANTLGVPV